MQKEKFNLFVYGSLRDPLIFQSVCDYSFTNDKERLDEDRLFAEPAFLGNHKKVSPDNVYFYAVAHENIKIEGFVIYDIPSKAVKDIDWYEGKRYTRESVKVNTADGLVDTFAYLASPKIMKEDFGDRWHVNLIEEFWLRKRIEDFIKQKTRPGDTTDDAHYERIAQRELLATTERDLLLSQYRRDAFNSFYIEQELEKPRPSIRHLYDNPNAIPYIENYLTLVVKQVILNRLEVKIREKYRYRLEHIRTSKRYFKRIVSLLAALRMINSKSSQVDKIVNDSIVTMPYRDHDLFDYIKYAARFADTLFDSRMAKNQIDHITSSIQPGITPLGFEIELSNLGYNAIASPNQTNVIDDAYDGFRYFNDFSLDVLCWKVGGCVDDHSGETDSKQRQGFLEFAPGRLNIVGELSRPATEDPWMLNQLVINMTKFYNVKPHSMHLSIQMRKKQIGRQKLLPLGFVKCLLAIGGGLEKKNDTTLWVSRVGRGEITQQFGGDALSFTLTGKRKWYLGDDETGNKEPSHAMTSVLQYKFMRLKKGGNYEPLVLCLKGLQIAYNPSDYITIEQLKHSPKLRRDFKMLRQWASQPKPIARSVIKEFLETVRHGLMTEARGKPAHKLHYIDWAMRSIEVQLRLFNKLFVKKTAKK